MLRDLQRSKLEMKHQLLPVPGVTSERADGHSMVWRHQLGTFSFPVYAWSALWDPFQILQSNPLHSFSVPGTAKTTQGETKTNDHLLTYLQHSDE